ncbi:MAG: hypothetical protein HGB20_08940 [Chlorobiaceae bacterium]|nr:hypothetical protein [Chlorobiaceae bacterium]
MALLTTRMKNWLEGTGAHIGTASTEGIPTVIVAAKASFDNSNTVVFDLSARQIDHIRKNVESNPQVALGPGGLGSIRAAYQFKGTGRIEGSRLKVAIEEIYSTKPGPEAGLRLDTLPFESVLRFEKTRWQDDGPPASV